MLSLAAAGAMTLSAMPVLTASAKDVSKMTPFEIAADMGVGWNLGNTLDSHDGTNHKSLGLNAETYWGNPKTTKALIDAVKAKGFNTIRVPVTWYPHADANFNIDTAWMDRVKEVVDWCIDEDTYVILNIHHEEWNTPTNANYSAASKELKAFWKQIASIIFASLPQTTVAAISITKSAVSLMCSPKSALTKKSFLPKRA